MTDEELLEPRKMNRRFFMFGMLWAPAAKLIEVPKTFIWPIRNETINEAQKRLNQALAQIHFVNQYRSNYPHRLLLPTD